MRFQNINAAYDKMDIACHWMLIILFWSGGWDTFDNNIVQNKELFAEEVMSVLKSKLIIMFSTPKLSDSKK